ncbi:MAG: nitroreductase/quinone reductase family protein [Gordonia sp. (in: high G+C Gram-positive bacteria)]|uniref:nitroreductase/quinone reductase family protein n=1 Tax=Gordonia sp. (in: high G+C Gram-positive bacteria) TaxID=84139 RepID=UPI003C7934E9
MAQKLTDQAPIRYLHGIITKLAILIGSLTWLPKYLPWIVKVDNVVQRLSNKNVDLLRIAGLPGITITVPGRKSGVLHSTTMLTAPDGDGWLVAGSFFGGPKTPAWVFNIRAVDSFDVSYHGVTSRMVATELDGTDRSRAWDQLLSVWPNFTMYEERTDRVIPLFRLAPVPAA